MLCRKRKQSQGPKEILEHSDIKTTDIYIDENEESIKKDYEGPCPDF
jgi:site-specific recombinase XerD